jgi:uncharacterized membrane protein (DUF106 family)
MSKVTSFTRADAIAFALALGLLVSYSLGGVRASLGELLNSVFGLIALPLPFLVVLVLFAVITAFVSTTTRGVMTDTDEQQAANEKMAELQQKIAPGVDGSEDLSLDEKTSYQKQAMNAQLTIIKMQFRPLGWILMLSLPVFLWLSWKVGIATGATAVTEPVVMPLVGATAWSAPLIGPIQTWIVVYIFLSSAFAQLLLKTLGWNIPSQTAEKDD